MKSKWFPFRAHGALVAAAVAGFGSPVSAQVALPLPECPPKPKQPGTWGKNISETYPFCLEASAEEKALVWWEDMVRTAAWIEAHGRYPAYVDRVKVDPEDQRYRQPYYTEREHGGPLRVEYISLFIEAGPAIIPALMRYLHDWRRTEWYHPGPPYYSTVSLPGRSLRYWAMFLIEATLRKDPEFALGELAIYTADTICDGTKYTGWDPVDAYDDAADAYEEWYRRCFDENKLIVTCRADQLPQVHWRFNDLPGPRKTSVEPVPNRKATPGN